MNTSPWRLGHPAKNGLYFVSIKAPQETGGWRLYFVAQWGNGAWQGLPGPWASEVSQWMDIPPPLPEGDNSGN